MCIGLDEWPPAHIGSSRRKMTHSAVFSKEMSLWRYVLFPIFTKILNILSFPLPAKIQLQNRRNFTFTNERQRKFFHSLQFVYETYSRQKKQVILKLIKS